MTAHDAPDVPDAPPHPTPVSGLDDLVIVCGATFWAGTRLLDQHLAEELSAYAPVLYVDPPVSALTRFRNPQARTAAGPAGLDRVADRIWRLSPHVLPLKERPGGKQVALALTRRAMRSAVRELGARSVRAVIVPSLNPLFGAVDEQYSVFYAGDDYVAGARLLGINPRRLERRARRQPVDADIVVGVSPKLVADLRAPGIEPALIPNGCDVDLFSRTPVPAPSGRPTVAFVGHLSERVDVRYLEAVAETGLRLLMIGPRQTTMQDGHFAALARHPNVEWVGAVPYVDLPDALADTTTCLLPYGDSDFNRASFPLKVLEYLAAGRRVVSTDLPAIEWLDTDLVTVAASPAAFAEAVRASLSAPLTSEEVDRRRAFASTHTWENRVRQLAGLLGLGA
jgi:teichuronic acid biosynthesis glycosyltransferase TuaH